jgi:uncharacterized protein involved in response to NO
MIVTGATLPSRLNPLAWHIHEMLFGFVMAAVAGFLLTAIPNWTGRPPVSGGLLASLAGLWLLGRIACVASSLASPWLAVVADLSFPVMLVGVVAREIVAGRNWRNLPIIVAVSIFGFANLLMHLEAKWHRYAGGARMASRSRRGNRADLRGGRPHCTELHPELVGEARSVESPCRA